MSRRRLLPLLAGLVATIAVTAAACGGSDERLTIYSGRSEQLVGPLLEQFSEESGIPIDVRYGDSTDLALLIAEEGDNSPADVFLSQSPGAVGFLAAESLLAPISEGTTALVAEGFRGAGGLWVGLSGRQRVLVYNEELVSEQELPSSVLELTDPGYAGRVAVAPSNASFQDFVTVMRQTVGEDETLAWLTAMADGGAPVYANNNAIVEAVGRGEVPMGLVNHYYNYRFLEEDPGLPSRNHVFPGGDIGAMVLVSTASVLASSAHPEKAERFVAFLLSPEAQEYFAEETFEYPLVSGVAPSDGLPNLATLELPVYEIEALGGELAETARIIDASGIDE